MGKDEEATYGNPGGDLYVVNSTDKGTTWGERVLVLGQGGEEWGSDPLYFVNQVVEVNGKVRVGSEGREERSDDRILLQHSS